MSQFTSPIGTRYKAQILSQQWSSDSKITNMRQLWINLAIFQKELGISSITEEGIKEMQDNLHIIDYERIRTNRRNTNRISFLWNSP